MKRIQIKLLGLFDLQSPTINSKPRNLWLGKAPI